MAVPAEQVPVLLDAIVHFALAALFLSYGFYRREHRAFGLYLITNGLINAAWVLAQSADTPEAAAFWWRVVPYFWLAYPFAVLHFVQVYPRRRRWLPAGPFGAAPLLAGVVLIDALYLLDHGLFWAGGAPGASLGGPLWEVVRFTIHPSLALAALVFARDYVRMAESATRSSVYLVSLAFAFSGLAASLLAALRRALSAAGVAGVVGDASFDLRFGAFAVLVAYVAYHAARSPEPAVRTRMRRYLAVLALAALGPLALGIAAQGDAALFSAWAGGAALGAVNLLFLGTITYATFRHHLLGIDLGLKRSIRQGTLIAGFVTVYLVVSQAAQALVTPGVGPYAGLFAAGLLVFTIVPMQRLAGRVANALLPGVEATPEYFDRRRLAVYRAALERAHAEGTPADDAALAALREELGISDRDHAILDYAVRGGRRPPPNGHGRFEPGATVLGRYRVIRLLGEGSAGRTHLAEDTVEPRRVALKVLRPERAEDPRQMAAFLREARLLGQLDHPNLLKVHAVEPMDGGACAVLEYADGGSLEDRLRDGARLPLPEALRITDHILAGLEAAHACGVVHGDVKAANVLLTGEGGVKVSDFGSARPVRREAIATRSGLGQAGGEGTLATMAPEVARGGQGDERADLYSVGAVLYRMLAGRDYIDFTGKSDFQAREAILRRTPRLPLDGVGEDVNGFLRRALAKRPEARFASAEQMRREVARLLARPAA